MEKKLVCDKYGQVGGLYRLCCYPRMCIVILKDGFKSYNGRCMSEGKGHAPVTGRTKYMYPLSLLEKSSTTYIEKLSFSIVCWTTDLKNSPETL